MPFATLAGIRVNYVIQGAGPPLLMFAPGGFRSVIARWTAQGGKREWQEMDGLAALSRHFTCIAYDRRESGLSGGRVEPLGWDLYVKEAKALLDLAGAKRAHILGSCMGAALALAFAVRHPEACASLLLHWPVGGYRWMMKGRTFFQRHSDFVRAHGLEAVVARAPQGENFWLDPEIGPWGSPAAVYPEFGVELKKFPQEKYLQILDKSRDALFGDTMPSGASGAELMKIDIPAVILPGADSSHAYSAAWALKELMPRAELWDVMPPQQNGDNTLREILRFTSRPEAAAPASERTARRR
jgi:pimeloyl-ACP methyl ester carboxylesterase